MRKTCHLSSTNDVAIADQRHNTTRAPHEWIGRKVRKHFDGHGFFCGHITDLDDNAESSGQNLFKCTYSDGDTEWIDADEVERIMLPAEQEEQEVCVYKFNFQFMCVLFFHDCFALLCVVCRRLIIQQRKLHL